MSNPLLLNAVQESQLFTTSAVSDVQVSRGYLKIGEMSRTKLSLISDLIQVKYKAETVQVVTITTSSITPAGNTYYTIEFGDTNRSRGGVQEQLKRVSYLTPADVTTLGATAALQREAINAALVTSINLYTGSYYVTAASSGGGNGITITDSTGYYPVNAQGMTNRLGATYVKTCKNPDGSGFLGTEASITTAAVYSFGVGADLAAWKPVIDQMWGNLISGYLGGTAPKTAGGAYATTGQKYDGFAVIALAETSISTSVRTQTAYMPKIQIAYVDNGTGSDTTNATAFAAFEKQFQRQQVNICQNDVNAFGEFFDNRPVFSGTGTAGIPTGSDGDINQIITKSWSWPYYIKGASTQIFPLWDTTNGSGLILDLDNAAEGLEIATQPLGTANQEFVVGKQGFSLYYKGTITDVSQANPFYVGFRKKQAFNTAISGYTDYAALGFNASAATQTIKVMTNLASAGEVSTSSTKTWADGATHVFELRVDPNSGTVTFLVDSVDVSSVQATAFAFAAGTVVIPWIRAIGTGGGAPTNTANAWIVMGNTTWRQ